MIAQPRRNVAPVMREPIRNAWRDEIAADVFELWLGISRLMARIRGPILLQRRSVRAAKRAPSKRHRAARRRAA
jgi:hypothetical protein